MPAGLRLKALCKISRSSPIPDPLCHGGSNHKAERPRRGRVSGRWSSSRNGGWDDGGRKAHGDGTQVCDFERELKTTACCCFYGREKCEPAIERSGRMEQVESAGRTSQRLVRYRCDQSAFDAIASQSKQAIDVLGEG